MLSFGVFDIVLLLVFVTWCVAVFFFLLWMSKRAKKSAAEPDPARQGMDELIEKVEKAELTRGRIDRDS